ncbi:MAG: bifunctional 2-C-methyl-D-erythritol 4-phosphate cytidylyltransferase/2-C-methyl-D-erythritol 2,4-cyclodiphosphate synthase [Sneathiella sp.]
MNEAVSARNLPAMTVIALIVAAGTGSRTGLDFPKQYLKLGKKSVLSSAIDQFLIHPSVDHVQVIINPNDEDLYCEAIENRTVLPWVAGGKTRQESVRLGLESIKQKSPTYVLIHDAARPFVDKSLIDRCLAGLKESDAVLPAMPVIDTLKSVESNIVTGTVDRAKIVAAQTPQSFNYNSILSAHTKFLDEQVTDDIALAELAGIPVKWVMGDAANIKITTKEDIEMVTNKSLTDSRSGLGFDVHAFADDRDLWLGGIKVPYSRGLKGHSDADVALHAITDALLGSIGAGDIGTHFPPSDEKWRGVSSDRFLAHAGQLVADLGGKIGNIDLTIICEAPKIGPYRDAMKSRIAEILNIDAERVSIKGTTTEKLGFTGRGEGIAAQAIATVRLPE